MGSNPAGYTKLRLVDRKGIDMKRLILFIAAICLLHNEEARAMCAPQSANYEYHEGKDGWYFIDTKISEAESGSFHVLNQDMQYTIFNPCKSGPDFAYAADKFHVYRYGVSLSDADPATFLLVDDGYARDAKHVYYEGKILHEADAGTFEQITSGDFFKDSGHVYIYGTAIKDADPATFALIEDGSFPGGGLAQDALHVYFASGLHDAEPIVPIPGVNAKDVKGLGNLYWRSDGAIFFGDKPIAGADAATFSVPKERELAFTAEDKDHYFIDDLLDHRTANKSECRKVGPIVLACENYILVAGRKYSRLDSVSILYLDMDPTGYMIYQDIHGKHSISATGLSTAVPCQ